MPLLDETALDATEVARDVADEVVAVDVAEDLLPERTGLLEVDCTQDRTVVNIRYFKG